MTREQQLTLWRAAARSMGLQLKANRHRSGPEVGRFRLFTFGGEQLWLNGPHGITYSTIEVALYSLDAPAPDAWADHLLAEDIETFGEVTS